MVYMLIVKNSALVNYYLCFSMSYCLVISLGFDQSGDDAVDIGALSESGGQHISRKREACVCY